MSNVSRVSPCSRSRCQHCQKRTAIFLIDGFGILRRRHETKCPHKKVTPVAPEAVLATSETSTERDPATILTGSEAASSSSRRRVSEASEAPLPPAEQGSFWQRLSNLTAALRCRRRAPVPAARAAASGASRSSRAALEGERTEFDHFKASPLLSTFHAVNLESGRSTSSEAVSSWLRKLEAKATFARQSVRVPPEGEGWSVPCEHTDSRWTMQLWYKWSGPTTISTLSRVKVKGTFCEVLSLFREPDKVSNWLPFVKGGGCTWSQDMPAMIFSFEAKLPIVPRRFSTLIHRAFIDDADATQTQGVYIIEWTPPAEDVESGSFCGMAVPPTPAKSSAMQVNLSTTFVCPDPEEQDCCVIIMAGENDFGVNQRLVPDLVLRNFLMYNCKVVANNMNSCLQDPVRFGYAERIEKDAQGFYMSVQKRLRVRR